MKRAYEKTCTALSLKLSEALIARPLRSGDSSWAQDHSYPLIIGGAKGIMVHLRGADEKSSTVTSRVFGVLVSLQSTALVSAIYSLHSLADLKADTHLGYFSFENAAPSIYWVLLVVSTILCYLTVTYCDNDKLILSSLAVMVLIIRAPIFFLFGLPAGFDTYAYTKVAELWRRNGIAPTDDPRTAWPVSYLLLYVLTFVGINPVDSAHFLPLLFYVLNTITIYAVSRVLFSSKVAALASFIIVLTPVFNLYYYSTYTAQLVASSFLLLALYSLFHYHRTRRRRYLVGFFVLVVILILSHHFSSLLLAWIMIAPWFLQHVRLILEKTGIQIPTTVSLSKHAKMGVGIAIVSMGYFQLMASKLLARYLTSVGRSELPSDMLLYKYPFSIQSMVVYGPRALPIQIPFTLFAALAALWYITVRNKRKLSWQETFNYSICVTSIALVIVSMVILQGLFIEIPRLIDSIVLFGAPLIATAIIEFQGKLKQFKTIIVLGLILTAPLTSLGVAVHDIQFTYHQEELEAILLVRESYLSATVFTDERLVHFTAYFAPELVIKILPSTIQELGVLADIERQERRNVFVLISPHSIYYNSYRQTFHGSPDQLLQFLNSCGEITYERNGVALYKLLSSQERLYVMLNVGLISSNINTHSSGSSRYVYNPTLMIHMCAVRDRYENLSDRSKHQYVDRCQWETFLHPDNLVRWNSEEFSHEFW